jgi:hypothetical protein
MIDFGFVIMILSLMVDRSPDRLGYGYSWAFRFIIEPSDEVDILSNMTNTSGPN